MSASGQKEIQELLKKDNSKVIILIKFMSSEHVPSST